MIAHDRHDEQCRALFAAREALDGGAHLRALRLVSDARAMGRLTPAMEAVAQSIENEADPRGALHVELPEAA